MSLVEARGRFFWLLSGEALRQSPSKLDGLSEEEENQFRRSTATFIEHAGEWMTL